MKIINKEVIDKFMTKHADSSNAFIRWICFTGTHGEYDRIDSLTILQR